MYAVSNATSEIILLNLYCFAKEESSFSSRMTFWEGKKKKHFPAGYKLMK